MKALTALFFLFPLLAAAKSFTLIDDATKETYVCNSVATASATATAAAAAAPAPPTNSDSDPDCVTKVAKLCRERGAMSEVACFDLATRRCQAKSARYADCARSNTQACIDSASGSAAACLDRSLRECK